VDTGCNVTAVAPSILRQLGISIVLPAVTQTAGGAMSVNLFEISLTMSGTTGAAGPMFVRPTLLVMELMNPLPDVEVLVGMDVLAECITLIDGPARQFTLSF